MRGRGYPNPSGTAMRFNFSSPLGMGRVTGKYMRIGYGDGEGKTRPHPAPLPCLRVVLEVVVGKAKCYDLYVLRVGMESTGLFVEMTDGFTMMFCCYSSCCAGFRVLSFSYFCSAVGLQVVPAIVFVVFALLEVAVGFFWSLTAGCCLRLEEVL
ncbi:transmembrane protein, putative [Medicago truncatula]|uniref:Transmembrane protein, putative n=1 Tax=Medicago truncatula TaxID=3880 RepID=G7ZXG0_MEDTR|nr:transmembrane protein, putative [Medicago truncatula]